MPNIPESVVRKAVDQIFKRYDQDNSGMLDRKQLAGFFNQVFRILKIPMNITSQKAYLAMKMVDKDKDGKASKEEVLAAVMQILGNKEKFASEGKNNQNTENPNFNMNNNMQGMNNMGGNMNMNGMGGNMNMNNMGGNMNMNGMGGNMNNGNFNGGNMDNMNDLLRMQMNIGKINTNMDQNWNNQPIDNVGQIMQMNNGISNWVNTQPNFQNPYNPHNNGQPNQQQAYNPYNNGQPNFTQLHQGIATFVNNPTNPQGNWGNNQQGYQNNSNQKWGN